jgi:hypothetical protein
MASKFSLKTDQHLLTNYVLLLTRTILVIFIVLAINKTRRKLAAWSCSIGAGIFGVLFVDYELPAGYEREHVFSGIQRSKKDFIDKYWWGIDRTQDPYTQTPDDRVKFVVDRKR